MQKSINLCILLYVCSFKMVFGVISRTVQIDKILIIICVVLGQLSKLIRIIVISIILLIMQSLNNIFENEDNIFLKMPHFFKPVQALNSVVIAICIGSTASGENGILWFTVIVSLLVSAASTILFALRIQDELMESLTNGSIAWNVVELIYSFILAVLSVICVWLSFSFANRSLYGTSAGYIASGLFFIVSTILYAIPCSVIYKEVQHSVEQDRQNIVVEPAHPFRSNGYQDL